MAISASKPRQSGIELLKIFCMLGIIILHINNAQCGGALDHATKPWNFIIMNFLQQLFYCAVNVFVIISGYFLSNRNKVSVVKPLILLIQVISFSILFYAFSCVTGKAALTPEGVINCFIPASYFVILYSAMYLVSPLINKCLSGFTDKKLSGLVLLLLGLFSVEPWLVDVLETATGKSYAGLSFIGVDGSGGGYTIINFILCYIVGLWIRKVIDIDKIKTGVLFILFVIVFGFNFCCRLWIPAIPVEYCSPFVIAQAGLVFCLFLKLDFSNKVVNSLAKASFTVYLLNSHLILIAAKYIQKAVTGNPAVMLGVVLALCVGIYAASYIIHMLYDFIINRQLLYRIVNRFDLEKKLTIKVNLE